MKPKTSKKVAKGYDFSKGRRGSVMPQRGKTRITIWIDNDVLRWFREMAEHQGKGYQTTLNDALKAHAARDHEPLRGIVREVVREELRGRRAS